MCTTRSPGNRCCASAAALFDRFHVSGTLAVAGGAGAAPSWQSTSNHSSMSAHRAVRLAWVWARRLSAVRSALVVAFLPFRCLSKQSGFTQLQRARHRLAAQHSDVFGVVCALCLSNNGMLPTSTSASSQSVELHFDVIAAASTAALIASPLGVRLSARLADLTLRRMFAIGLTAMAPSLWPNNFTLNAIKLQLQQQPQSNLQLQCYTPSTFNVDSCLIFCRLRQFLAATTVVDLGCVGGCISWISEVCCYFQVSQYVRFICNSYCNSQLFVFLLFLFLQWFVGFGAGILMTTFLSVSTDLRQQQVIGMSLASLALPNIAQSVMHLRAGTVNKPVALAICVGALIGAPLGSAAALEWMTERCDTFLPAF
jgi:hypothetical protein